MSYIRNYMLDTNIINQTNVHIAKSNVNEKDYEYTRDIYMIDLIMFFIRWRTNKREIIIFDNVKKMEEHVNNFYTFLYRKKVFEELSV